MLQSGVRLGPYEILGPLGTGGMGEVYRARDSRLDRDVAIKVVPLSVAGILKQSRVSSGSLVRSRRFHTPTSWPFTTLDRATVIPIQ